jgi:hypothetical protein
VSRPRATGTIRIVLLSISRRAAAVAATALLLTTAGAAQAGAAEPGGATAPSYPGNTLKVEVPGGRLIAGSVQTVKLSGHARWNEPGDTIGYTLSVYVQDADVSDSCATWHGEQLQKSINLGGLNATGSISGWVVDDSLQINPDPARQELDWSGDATPFSVRPGVRRVVVCAYQRYVIDDVASYQLPVRIEQPACRLLPGAARRGRPIAARCNVSGLIEARFSRAGQRARTVRFRVGRSGRATVVSRTLAAGRWRVAFRSRDVPLGRDAIRLR